MEVAPVLKLCVVKSPDQPLAHVERWMKEDSSCLFNGVPSCNRTKGLETGLFASSRTSLQRPDIDKNLS